MGDAAEVAAESQVAVLLPLSSDPIDLGQRRQQGYYARSALPKEHIEALEKAGLPLPTVYPTLNEAVEKLKIDIAEKDSEEAQSKQMKKARDNNRATYFCIGVSTGHRILGDSYQRNN